MMDADNSSGVDAVLGDESFFAAVDLPRLRAPDRSVIAGLGLRPSAAGSSSRKYQQGGILQSFRLMAMGKSAGIDVDEDDTPSEQHWGLAATMVL